ncbi:MAG: glycosyltransferase family 2 protein, partial [Solirubrobacteraceae bacterium]
MTAPVSVIIRARDEAKQLRRCLAALRGQEGVSEIETIYVDTGSTDGSLEVAKTMGAKSIATPGLAPFSFGGALNIGAANANGEAFVALSAHVMLPDAGWLARAAAALTDPTVACASGDVYGPDGERLAAATHQDAALARRRPEWGYANGAGAFRASLWRQRPFRDDLPGCEDKEWALHWLERGYVCRVDPALAVGHDHTHDSLRAIFHRAEREERAYAAFLEGRENYGPRELAHDWWSDLRWYDSALRARLS